MFLVGLFVVPAFGGQALHLGENAGLLIPVSLSISLCAICFALAAPAGAQDADADLRARQEALFEQLLAEPDNLDLEFLNLSKPTPGMGCESFCRSSGST